MANREWIKILLSTYNGRQLHFGNVKAKAKHIAYIVV
jgi:hypothetical protein